MRTAIFKDDEKYLTDKPVDIDVINPGQKLTINGLDYIVIENSISITDDPHDFPITQYLLVEEVK